MKYSEKLSETMLLRMTQRQRELYDEVARLANRPLAEVMRDAPILLTRSIELSLIQKKRINVQQRLINILLEQVKAQRNLIWCYERKIERMVKKPAGDYKEDEKLLMEAILDTEKEIFEEMSGESRKPKRTANLRVVKR